MNKVENISKIKHLFSRAGFGLRYHELNEIKSLSIEKIVDGLFKKNTDVTDFTLSENTILYANMQEMSAQEKIEKLKQSREAVKDLNIEWLNRLANTKDFVREKITLFWHGHFACRSANAYHMQTLNNVQRKNSLGDFKTLLIAVSQTPAMLQFLNNQQNRKGHPNENFARELMELFTIGRGNYTEQDVKEAARAFTGWMFNRQGEFQYRLPLHDEGSKTFFNKTGNFDGNDIIDLILTKKQTAYFLSEKLYKFYVNDTPHKKNVDEMGEYLFNNDYNIESYLRKMFTSDWFYSPENMGNKIKSPIEFIAGLNRQFAINYQNPKVLLKFQQVLGQTLFYPPNVSGWSGGRNWIDSSSLMVRLKIPSSVLAGGIIQFDGKADPEDEAIIALNNKQNKQNAANIKAIPNWQEFQKNMPAKISKIALADFILQAKLNDNDLKKITDGDVKSMVIQLLSTPAYQLV